MISRKPYSIYIILDTQFFSSFSKISDLARICREENVDFVQFRDKESPLQDFLRIAERLHRIFKNSSTKLIINDRLDVSLSLGCGLHLGRDDFPLERVVSVFPRGLALGFTVHNQDELSYANRFNLDYVSFGPVFRSFSKPQLKPQGIERLVRLRKKSIHRVFAIGGINLDNIVLLKEKGIKDVVISSGFCLSPQPQEFLRKVKRALR